jgi:integrase
MPSLRFTEKSVLTVEVAAGQPYEIFWDATCPHLGLRVCAEADEERLRNPARQPARSYVFQARLHGRALRTTIGDIRSWPLGEARREARRLMTLVDRGIDPRQVAEEQRRKAEAAQAEARRESMLLQDAWAAYLAARRPKWSPRHYRDHLKVSHRGGGVRRRSNVKVTAAGPLAALMNVKLSDLTAERVKQWLQKETASRPTSTALAFRLLRGFVNWTYDIAEYKGIVPEDACSARSVLDEVPRARTKEGDCLQREQLQVWFASVRALDNPVTAAYLQTLLLTGARREELAKVRWRDVDFNWNSLRLGDKIDGVRTIGLTPYVAVLLDALPRLNVWVFSSLTAASGRLIDARSAHTRALCAAGIPHISIHGLRRSFGTLSEWLEMPTGIVAQIQGHKPSAIAEKHYRRRPLDLLRLWHTKLETWILEQGRVPSAHHQEAAQLGVADADGSITYRQGQASDLAAEPAAPPVAGSGSDRSPSSCS